MDKELQQLLMKLAEIRKGVGQMVFFGSIFPSNVISSRSEIMKFKKEKPEIKEVDFIINSPGDRLMTLID